MSARIMCLAALVTLVSADDKLSTDYARDRKVRYESESSLEMETTMKRDGQADERMGAIRSTTERELAWVDKVLAHEEGKPTKVRRQFETLKQSSTTTMGDRDDTRDQEGTLAGVTLELTRGDGGEVEAKAVEGSASGDALHGHRLELALDALLPDGDKKADESWELDKDQVLRAINADLTKALFPPPAEEASSGGEGGRGRSRGRGGFSRGATALSQLPWEGKATLLEASEEYDGASCRVIKIEMSGEGTLEEPSWGGSGGRAFGLATFAPFETKADAKLEGRLLFDAQKRLPVRLELKGTLTIESSREFDTPDGQHMKFESTSEGEIKYETSVSVEE